MVKKTSWILKEDAVREMLDGGASLREIARRFKVSHQAVSRFLLRRGWAPTGKQKG